jgi:hypothetical protein
VQRSIEGAIFERPVIAAAAVQVVNGEWPGSVYCCRSRRSREGSKMSIA